MKICELSSTSAHASANERKMVFRAGTPLRPPAPAGPTAGWGRPAEGIQADLGHQMPRGAERLGHPSRRVQFDLMPLPVVERERIALVALAPRQRQASRRIQAPT